MRELYIILFLLLIIRPDFSLLSLNKFSAKNGIIQGKKTITLCGNLQKTSSKSAHLKVQIPSWNPRNSLFDTIILGGGCYWCIEAVYQNMKGVKSVVSGFSGGHKKNPSYYQVCAGNTGHAEVVQVIYDREVVSLVEILEVFFTMHDPTTINRQGADEGEQYRSVIFYRNKEQQRIALAIIKEINKNKIYEEPVVTAVETYRNFYPAEDEHQNYYNRNKEKSYCKYVIQPKLEKFDKLFKSLKKKEKSAD